MSEEHPAAPSIVIGTAGHVDHGKTELVKRLTGINTDRLAEEQERELSIDIGFAHLDMPSGARFGIVDVPGHERFVKNMLAGATGIDLVMLVVAADEGVMPQTREHLDIINLLGIDKGLIVLTKADLVDEELAELAAEDIRDEMAGTPLADAPLVRTSAKTGEGVEKLLELLDEVAATVEPRDTRGPARLPIDRVFTVTGFGSVVTGTLVRGQLAQGDEVELLPKGFTARIRGLQTHEVDAEEVTAAKRVAVNLQRLSGEGVARGDTLCAPGSMEPSGMLDVRLSLLTRAPAPLKQRTRIRLHHGTAELLGRVYFMDRDRLTPGETAMAQIRLEGLLAASRGDRCVLRSYSPMVTIGGAVVIDPTPRRHRRSEAHVVDRLEALEAGDAQDLALQWIGELPRPAFTVDELARSLQLDRPEAEALVGALADEGRIAHLTGTGQYADAEARRRLTASIQDALVRYHEAHPLSPAMPKEALQTELAKPPAALLDDVLAALAEGGDVAITSAGIRDAGHEVSVSAEQQRALDGMVGLAREARFSPPTREATLQAARRPPGEARGLLELVIAAGKLVPVGEHVYHGDALIDLEQRVHEFVEANGPFTIANLRDLTGSSRKYMVPLAEHLDGIGFTRRQGDLRTTVRPARDRGGSG